MFPVFILIVVNQGLCHSHSTVNDEFCYGHKFANITFAPSLRKTFATVEPIAPEPSVITATLLANLFRY